MKKFDVTRALRDPDYRESLSAAQLAMIPEHPAGPSSIADEALRTVAGGGCNLTFEPGTCHTGSCATFCV